VLQLSSNLYDYLTDDVEDVILESFCTPIIDIIPDGFYWWIAIDLVKIIKPDWLANDIAVLFKIDKRFILIKVCIKDSVFKIDLAWQIMFLYVWKPQCIGQFNDYCKSVEQSINYSRPCEPVGIFIGKSLSINQSPATGFKNCWEFSRSDYIHIHYNKILQEINKWLVGDDDVC